MDESVSFALRFEEGRLAARIGRSLRANHLANSGTDWHAWVAGYKSVNTSSLTSSERARIFFEGWSTAEVGMGIRACPYSISDHSEEVEVWLLGYTSADLRPPAS
jgi:hypothetical protein